MHHLQPCVLKINMPLQAAAAALRHAPLIGLDAEWRPSADWGQQAAGIHPPALVQTALQTDVTQQAEAGGRSSGMAAGSSTPGRSPCHGAENAACATSSITAPGSVSGSTPSCPAALLQLATPSHVWLLDLHTLSGRGRQGSSGDGDGGGGVVGAMQPGAESACAVDALRECMEVRCRLARCVLHISFAACMFGAGGCLKVLAAVPSHRLVLQPMYPTKRTSSLDVY